MINILIGKSGAGKDYMLNNLLKKGYLPIINCTTRPKRVGETDGKDYIFLSNEKFDKAVASGEIFEHREYKTLVENKPAIWKYGSIKQNLNPNKNYVIVVDLQGAEQWLLAYGAENCIVTYINATDEVREIRARKRGSFDECEWNRRLIDDNEKFSDLTLQNFCNRTGCSISTIYNNFLPE